MGPINLSLTDSQRMAVIDLLNHDLSDTWLLLVKTKKYDWDIIESQFLILHQLWEEQCTVLSKNIDVITERIKLLRGYPIITMIGRWQLFAIKDCLGNVPMAIEMVARLVDDHRQIIQQLYEHVAVCIQTYQDPGTADLLTYLIEEHEKMSWILRLFIQGESVGLDRGDFQVNEDISNEWIFGTGYKNC